MTFWHFTFLCVDMCPCVLNRGMIIYTDILNRLELTGLCVTHTQCEWIGYWVPITTFLNLYSTHVNGGHDDTCSDLKTNFKNEPVCVPIHSLLFCYTTVFPTCMYLSYFTCAFSYLGYKMCTMLTLYDFNIEVVLSPTFRTVILTRLWFFSLLMDEELWNALHFKARRTSFWCLFMLVGQSLERFRLPPQIRDSLPIYLVTPQSWDSWTVSHCWSYNSKTRNLSQRSSPLPHAGFQENLVLKLRYILERGGEHREI